MAAEDPAALAAWGGAARLYLAGWDNVRDDASGDYYADTATIDPDLAEITVRSIGGKVRTREQMLDDPDHPGLAEALLAWERDNDSVYAGVRAARARSRRKLVADRRAAVGDARESQDERRRRESLSLRAGTDTVDRWVSGGTAKASPGHHYSGSEARLHDLVHDC